MNNLIPTKKLLTCPWCSHTEEYLIKKSGAPKRTLGRKGAVSDQAICNKCQRHIKQ